MRSVSESEASPSGVSLPRPSDFLTAVGLLTCLPLPSPDPREAAFGRAAPLLPLVGAIISGSLAGVDWLIAPSLPAWTSAVALVALWEVLGRGGLRRIDADSFPISAVATIAKIVILTLLPVPRLLPLLLAPLLGAWSIVVLAVGSRDAATPARKLAPGVLFNEFAIASLVTFAVVFDLAEGLGIFVVVTVAAVLLALRFFLHERIGGLSARWLVRGSQLIEVLTLALLIPFQA